MKVSRAATSSTLTKPNFEQRRQIILLRREGLDLEQIAHRLGIPYPAVGDYCRRMGWDVPDLSGLLKTKPQPPQKSSQVRLNVAMILRWADRYHRRTGFWPRWNSGVVREAPGETWQQIDRALFLGVRGLAGGQTLLRLLRENGRIVPRRDAWRTEEDAVLGTASDQALARRLGRTEIAVAARRRQLGIARCR